MPGKFGAALASFTEDQQDWTWTLFRILSAAMFMTHGYSKLFGENPQPMKGGGMTTFNIADTIVFPVPYDINLLFIAGSIELFGGLLILIGLFTQFAAFMAALLMLMAYLTAHIAWFPTLNRGELAAAYFVVFLVLFAFGAGPYSVDSWRAMRREKKQQDKIQSMMRS